MARTAADRTTSCFTFTCVCMDTIAIVAIAIALMTPLWQVITLVDRRQTTVMESFGEGSSRIASSGAEIVKREGKRYPAIFHLDHCTTALTSLLLLGAAMIMGAWDIVFSMGSVKSPDRIHAAGTLMSTSAALAAFGGLLVFYENAIRIINALWLLQPEVLHESHLGYSFWSAFTGFCFFLGSSILHTVCSLFTWCIGRAAKPSANDEKDDKIQHVKYFVQ
uniref:Uncharacterized protein n=1 Tax=Trichuris muris TaxID=70415 RepID=A0A5S6QSR9_TRIMR